MRQPFGEIDLKLTLPQVSSGPSCDRLQAVSGPLIVCEWRSILVAFSGLRESQAEPVERNCG
jgi:hypothetical protein